VIVVVFLIAARVLIRLDKYLFQEIHEGPLKVRGFYPDWAEPTAKLVPFHSGGDCGRGLPVSPRLKQSSISRHKRVLGRSAALGLDIGAGPWSGRHDSDVYAVIQRWRGGGENATGHANFDTEE